MNTETRIAAGSIPVAFFFWYLIFGLEGGNFWIKIACCSAALAALSVLVFWKTGRSRSGYFTFRWRYCVIGVTSASLLYGVFWLGNLVLTSFFSGAEAKISEVYASRGDLPIAVIALLLLFVTSPAEELFWRGLIQRSFMKGSKWAGFIITTLIYTGVHIWTLNIPLLLAAFTAGAVWGLIFLLEENLLPVIISHALWTVSIFVLFPMA
jgi:hypothetical protein